MPIDYLPARWRPPAERLRDTLMTDAGVMIILGVVMITRGLSYWDLGSVILIHPIDLLFPTWVDSALWVTVGALLIVSSRWHSTTCGRLVLSGGTAFIAMWGFLFVFAPPAQFAQRGIMYLALSAIVIWSVWRGKRGEIRVRERTAHAGPH